MLDIEKDKFLSLQKMSDEKDYYNNVFKKTEKIISVTFYILSYIDTEKTNRVLYESVNSKVLALHEQNVSVLEISRHGAREQIEQLRHALVTLESTLRILAAARQLSSEVLFVLTTEIDAVVRTINHHYLELDEVPAAQVAKLRTQRAPQVERTTQRPQQQPFTGHDLSSDAAKVQAALPDRKTRILTVLEAAGEASIKDLSDVIRDCSEKTIQRELNDLIEKGKVIRIGERRWSRYSVLKEPLAD